MHAALPLIDGWKPTISLPDLNGVAQNRWDAIEVDMVEVTVAVETEIAAPGREIREYRFRFNKMRRALIRDRLVSIIDEIDAELRAVRRDIAEMEPHKKIWVRVGTVSSSTLHKLTFYSGAPPDPLDGESYIVI